MCPFLTDEFFPAYNQFVLKFILHIFENLFVNVWKEIYRNCLKCHRLKYHWRSVTFANISKLWTYPWRFNFTRKLSSQISASMTLKLLVHRPVPSKSIWTENEKKLFDIFDFISTVSENALLILTSLTGQTWEIQFGEMYFRNLVWEIHYQVMPNFRPLIYFSFSSYSVKMTF